MLFEAAEKDGVYPEVLFKVARHWFDLFVDSESVSSPQTSFQNTIPPQHPTGIPQLHSDVLQSQAHEVSRGIGITVHSSDCF